MFDKKLFGARLRELRKQMNVSQTNFAKHFNVTPSCVANWEAGIRTPDVNIWDKIAEYFGVSVDYLCCRSNLRNPIRFINLKPDPKETLDLSPLSETDKKRILSYYDFLIKKAGNEQV